MYYDFIKKLIKNNFIYSIELLNKIEYYQFNYTNIFIRVIDSEIFILPVISEKKNINSEILSVKTIDGKNYSTSEGYLFFNNEYEKYPLKLIEFYCKLIDKLLLAQEKRFNYLRKPFILKSNDVLKSQLTKFYDMLTKDDVVYINNFDSFDIEKIDLGFEDIDFNNKIEELKNNIKELIGFYPKEDKKERLIIDENKNNNDYVDSIYNSYKFVRMRLIDYLNKNNIECFLYD